MIEQMINEQLNKPTNKGAINKLTDDLTVEQITRPSTELMILSNKRQNEQIN